MKPDINSQLIDYLEGTLSDVESKALEAELAQSPELRRELQELEILLGLMDDVPLQQPSRHLSQHFRRFLAEEEREAKIMPPQKSARIFTLYRIEWSVAAAIVLLAVGIGFGSLWMRNQQQQDQINRLVAETENTRKMLILSMLQEQSASQRIKALNTAVEEQSADPQVIEALIQTLLVDDNVNVRMKAAEALGQFPRERQAITALTKALRTENSPEVQITLIDILTNLKAKEAIDEFKTLMKKEDLLEVVKTKAAYGVEILM